MVKLNFQQPLLQSSVPHDHSVLHAAQEAFIKKKEYTFQNNIIYVLTKYFVTL